MKQNYLDRAMRARDPRFAKIASRLGYDRRDLVARDPLDHDGDGRNGGSPQPDLTDDLAALRAEYERVSGRKPFYGWTADKLREKISAAKAEG